MEVLQFRQWVIGWKELAKILAYPGQTYSTQAAGSSSYQVDHQQLLYGRTLLSNFIVESFFRPKNS